MDINESKYLYIRPPKEVVLAVVVFLAVLVLFFGARLKNEIRGLNQPFPAATITVSGEGRVLAKPDIAVMNVGVIKQGADLVSVQNSAAQVMERVEKLFKEKGVAEKDIKTTAYSISPRYDYKEGEQIFRGYEVHQNFEVKVRGLNKVGDLLSGATLAGANQIGSLQFTLDDPKVARDEARTLAIREAKEKAAKLSGDLGVRIKKIVGFSESGDIFPPPIFSRAEAFGKGGEFIPPTPEGENEIRVIVNVTYEIR